MRLFHRTDHADAILRDGFRDAEGHYGFYDEEGHPMTDTGVWVSNIPLDANEGAIGNQLLQVEVPEAVMREYDYSQEGQGFREFLVPASVLNQHGPARLLSPEEEEKIIDPPFQPPPAFWKG
jgi:hypothetical protein